MRIIYIFPETPEGPLRTEWCDSLGELENNCALYGLNFLTVSVPEGWSDHSIQQFAERLTN